MLLDLSLFIVALNRKHLMSWQNGQAIPFDPPSLLLTSVRSIRMVNKGESLDRVRLAFMYHGTAAVRWFLWGRHAPIKSRPTIL